MDDQAIVSLCEFVGNDLSRLTNEVDKLLISLKPDERITADRVMSQVGVSKEYNIFELQKSILHKDAFVAAKIVNYFEGNTRKNPIIPTVAFLYSFFSKLLVASQVTDKSEKSLASTLKVSPYAIRDYSLALRNYSPSKILENITLIKDADLKLKGVNSGSGGDGQIFRELVFRLMH
jgi:DNA polymerase-3 subunit delta